MPCLEVKRMASLNEFLNLSAKIGRIIVTAHVNADPDAVASAALIGYLASQKGIEVEYCFDSVSALSKKVLSNLEIKLPLASNIPPDKPYLIAVCDTAAPQLLGKCEKLLEDAKEILVIDHHAVREAVWHTKFAFIEPEEPAASVVTAYHAKSVIDRLPNQLATLLMSGILYDTRRFLEASPKTFHVMEWLYPQGNYTLAYSLLSEQPSRSERIAKLKGVTRAVLLDVCGYIVAVTQVSAYEAAVARALVGLGADIAIVVGGSGVEVRASLRASRGLLEKGLSLDVIIKEIAEKIGGTGGGHPGAAGYNYRVRNKKAARKTRSKVTRLLLVETVESILSSLC